jgi:hypothetical protein
VTGATGGYHKDSIAGRLKNNILYYILYILIYRVSNKRLHNTAFDPVTASLRSLNAAESCLTVILRTTSADSSVMEKCRCQGNYNNYASITPRRMVPFSIGVAFSTATAATSTIQRCWRDPKRISRAEASSHLTQDSVMDYDCLPDILSSS